MLFAVLQLCIHAMQAWSYDLSNDGMDVELLRA